MTTIEKLAEAAAVAAWVAYCTPKHADPDERWDADEPTPREYAMRMWNESPEVCTHIGADGFRRCARAAVTAILQALREPGEGMVDAGLWPWEDDSPVASYKAMIDAALSQSGEG